MNHRLDHSPIAPSRNRRRLCLSVFGTILIVGLAIWHARQHWGEYRQTPLPSGPHLLLLILLILIRMLLRSWLQWRVLTILNVPISFLETTALSIAATLMSSLVPGPVGAGYRAVYLKQRFGLSYSHFAGASATINLLFMIGSVGFGLAAWIWITLRGIQSSPTVGLLLGVAFVISSLMMVLPTTRWGSQLSIRRLDRIMQGWRQIIAAPYFLAFAIGTVVATALLTALSIDVAFRAYELPMDAAGALLLMSGQKLGALIRLTPGAIGFTEMAAAYFAQMLDTSSVQAITVFATLRIITSILVIVTGFPSWYLLSQIAVSNRVRSQ